MATTQHTCVEDIMSTPLVTVPPTESLAAAAETMSEADISALLVTTSPPSIVTSTDVLEAVAQERDTAALSVADVMTESVETIPPTIGIREAAAMLETYGISHLPVVKGDYLGMLSATDITEHLS